ncbi:MAG: OmpA family protein [Candidatus Kapabacteria bacterium]|nr:OmpA family protein [Candidatus Kapabacteria bacterium]
MTVYRIGFKGMDTLKSLIKNNKNEKLRNYLILIFLICFFIVPKVSLAQKLQDKPLFYLGVYADYNLNNHFTDFQQIPGYPTCCSNFNYGFGSGLAIGGLFEIPVLPKINAGVRVGFSSLSGVISKDENIGYDKKIFSQIPDTNLRMISAEHSINIVLYSLTAQPYILYKLYDRLTLSAGLNLAYLFKTDISQKEQITSPNDVLFLDTSNINKSKNFRNDSSNMKLPNQSSLLAFIVFGAGYEFPLNNRGLTIAPEINFHIPLNNICDLSWKVATVQLGASIKLPIYPAKIIPQIKQENIIRDTNVVYSMNFKEEKVILKESRSETKEIKTDSLIYIKNIKTENYEHQIPKIVNLSASIEAVGISKNNTRQIDPTVVIEETETEELFPLLPYLFFLSNSSDLSKSSIALKKTDNFSEKSLQWNTLGIYSELLQLVAYRLNANPNAKLTINGCNSGTAAELDNKSLSLNRAIAVRDVLVQQFGVIAEKLILKNQNIPDNPSTRTVAEGEAENQRVELSSDDPKILAPIRLKDILVKSDPPIIEINPIVKSDAGIESWTLDVEQENKNLRNYSGNAIPTSLKWSIEQEPRPKTETAVKLTLNLNDNAKQKLKVEKDLLIKQLTLHKKRFELKDDKRIERYALILFDFDKAIITKNQHEILEEIKTKIKANSFVTIKGYADKIGDPDYNKELSLRRANEVQKFLKVKESNLKLEGIGSDELLYDNNLPQGRGYSRTVQIIIETPVKE